ncbi:hypothetical protein PC118_g22869, partial [Phytophthora cactorum]
MPRWSSMLLPTLALAPSQVHSSNANQMDFAACLIQHSPEYLCCECTETTKVLYTKYNRPSGGDYESYYIDGWNKQRQVNFPYVMYHPQPPKFYYNDPSTICRVQAVANMETGELMEELQCTNTNSSLATASRDNTVFWTYPANVGNNNASFPVGANCYSLMLRDGSVDSDLKATCVSTSTSTTPRFTTYTETPLVVIHLLYLAFFVVLGGWMNGLQELLAEDQPVRERDEQEAHCYPAGTVKSCCGQCYWSSHGPSVGLNVLLIIIIADFYRNFDPLLFDTTEDNALVFIIVWVITAIWFVVIVSMQDRIFNFFRLRVPLD